MSNPVSAGAGRDGKLRELIDQWRDEATDADKARDSGDNIEWDAGKAIRRCADELDAILAVPDPLASDTEQANWLREFRRQWHRDGKHSRSMVECMEPSCLALFAAEGATRRASSVPLASSSETQGENTALVGRSRFDDWASQIADADHLATSAPSQIEYEITEALQEAYLVGLTSSSVPVRASGEPQKQPPEHVIELAVEVSSWSPCRSKRGVVIFSEGNVISHGYNYKPRGFDCDGSAECKASCRREAVHAEQQALMAAGNRAHASEMLHVKTVDGKLVPSGGPSCVECSKLARAAGIAWVWLYHDTGWRRYAGDEFHALSLASASPSDDGARQPLKPEDIAAHVSRQVAKDAEVEEQEARNANWKQVISQNDGARQPPCAGDDHHFPPRYFVNCSCGQQSVAYQTPAAASDDGAAREPGWSHAMMQEFVNEAQQHLSAGRTAAAARMFAVNAMMGADLYIARKHAADLQTELTRLECKVQPPDVSQKYYELLYAVARVHPGESRHETALRYIRQAEQHIGGPTSATQPKNIGVNPNG